MNIFENIPIDFTNEKFEEIISSKHIRIERIISKGHKSDEDFWYDQEENEWVMVLKGSSCILFQDREYVLMTGDYLNIPAHTKHQVKWTNKDIETIWLAIFYI